MRNKFYDNIRGFSIILVVVGHAIQLSFPNDFDSVFIFRLIYSFHMPLFMFLSGLVTYKKDRYIDVLWLKNKFFGLVVPFVSWIMIPFVFKGNWEDFLPYIKKVIISPDWSNWFLWILFLNAILLWISENMSLLFDLGNRGGVFLSIVCIIFINVLKKYVHVLGMGLLAWYSIFYFSGYYVGKYKEHLFKYKRCIGLVLSGFWILLVPFWNRINDPNFGVLLRNILNEKEANDICLIYRYLVAFCGIGFAFSIIYIISKYLKLKCINELGKNTLEIYVLQGFFFNILAFQNTYLKIILNILLGVSIPYIISHICHEGYISKILFGKK